VAPNVVTGLATNYFVERREADVVRRTTYGSLREDVRGWSVTAYLSSPNNSKRTKATATAKKKPSTGDSTTRISTNGEDRFPTVSRRCQVRVLF
jgi:hypothetical protein